ncbi:MAG: S-adenosylmethionine synthetase [Nitrosomonadales bacterium]|nr:MAG: S-adenosylmethionine synthetase [Nitrosomonadales bacterium]
MSRNIIITPFSCIPVEQRGVEMCEHKGLGHPDTLADGVCEAASRALSLAYLKTYGRILHHNLDKGLLAAGRSTPRFGGGTIEEKARLIICGRATRPDPAFDVQEIVAKAARDYLETHLQEAAAGIEIDTHIREGSANLKQVFARSTDIALANDTSFGMGFAPFSPLEQNVLDLAEALRSTAFRQHFPCAGADFKVMGMRVENRAAFTVALAFVDRHVASVSDYRQQKAQIREYLSQKIGQGAGLQLNTLDDPAATDESGLYLTVSGLSSEMGDDGQVGRGNRASGLITPARPMSLEAVAGKNPVSHVGKLYNVLAMLMARDIHQRLEEAKGVTVQILSAIGAPVDQPQVAAIEIQAAHGLGETLQREAASIAGEWLQNIPKVTALILDQAVSLY